MKASTSTVRFFRWALIVSILLSFVTITSCENVMITIGIISEDDDDDPVIPIDDDVSLISKRDVTSPTGSSTGKNGSHYDEVAIISNTRQITIPESHSGQRVYYLVTNPTSKTHTVWFPLEGVFSGTIAAKSIATPEDSVFDIDEYTAAVGSAHPQNRAIRGYPGQHEPLEYSLPADWEVHANTIGGSAVSFSVDDTNTFDVGGPDISARLHSQVIDGEWSVNIWVVYNEDVDATDSSVTISTAQTDELAQKFMLTGSTNDIFAGVTSVFGLPWGDHSQPAFIEPTRKDIHVLLYDIRGDGVPSSGDLRIAGYFSSKDSYIEAVQFQDNEGNIDPTIKSNARLMFYIDSALFADDNDEDGTWELTDDYWPREMVSTLAHEFQHMIQYYQRNVALGSGDAYDTWLNEMSSVVAEDLASRSIAIPGPRAVSSNTGGPGTAGIWLGRMPYYNLYGSVTPVATWSNTLEDYSASYSFGAYLVRTYGSDMFQQLLTTVNLDENATPAVTYTADSLVSAASTASGSAITFGELMRRWGVSMITSDDTKVPEEYRINTGDWIQASEAGTTVGSINAFNYVIENGDTILAGPGFYPASSSGKTLTAYTNTFFLGPLVPATGLTATFTAPAGGTLTILTEGL